ncbi:MAG: GumC family protein [Pseudomonas sp.]|uniref:GumC family protein n=1 Tax=Pseudomonas sp. TaxID=306 RepID=UPI003393E0E8
MTTRDLLNLLFKRKLVVVCFFLASLAGGFAGLSLIAPTYESTARLLVRIGQEDIYMPALASSQFRTPMMSVVREEQLHSEAAILTSATLARRVVDELTPAVLFPGIDLQHPWYTPKGVAQTLTRWYGRVEDYFFPLSANRSLVDKAVNRLRNDLSATALKSSNIIEVSLRNKDPHSAALGVNTLVQRYLTERVRIFQREQTAFFSEQLGQMNQQLAEAEAAVRQYRDQRQIVDVERQRSLQIDRLDDVRKRLDEFRVSVQQGERQSQVLRAQLASMPSTTELSGAQTSNSFAISEMNKQLADLKRQEADIGARFSSSDPRLQTLREEISVVDGLLTRQQAQRYGSSQQGINPLHARVRDDLLKNEALLAGYRQALTSWQALEGETRARMAELNASEAQYKQLVQQLDVLRDTRKLYLEKNEETRFQSAQAGAQIGNVSVVNWAVASDRPVSPKLWLVLIGVLLVGLFGGIGLAWLLELLDDSLKTDSDIWQYLQLPTITRVPELIPVKA